MGISGSLGDILDTSYTVGLDPGTELSEKPDPE
jgi:hypothetical protein